MPESARTNTTFANLPDANQQGFTETGTGREVGDVKSLQERFDEFVQPKRKRRLGQFLGERASIRGQQEVAQRARNEELNRRLGTSGTGIGQALHGAASARAGEAAARDQERARAEFDVADQAFVQNELQRLSTPLVDESVQRDAIVQGIFRGGADLLTTVAGGGAATGAFDIAGNMQAPEVAPELIDTALSTAQNIVAGDGGLDGIGGAFSARAGGGGFGQTPGQEEEERRRRQQRAFSSGFPEVG
jgi:hypothetical protein